MPHTNIIEDLYPSRCETEARFLPRRDPVVHGQWTPDAPLTNEQVARFDADG